MRSLMVMVAALSLAACSHRISAPARATSSPPDLVSRESELKIAPYGDYHAHLFSRRNSERYWTPQLPPVAVPQPLADLLRQRAQLAGGHTAFRNRLALVKLYSRDSLILDYRSGRNNWVKGAEAASMIASSQAGDIFKGLPFVLTPIEYRLRQSDGHVTGYFTQDVNAVAQHVGTFHLSLIKNETGRWIIAAETSNLRAPVNPQEEPAEKLIAEMDAAGIQKAVVPSTAYWWGSSTLAPAVNEYANVQAENDWISHQVSRYPERLVGLCSFNPLRDYALAELSRCTRLPNIRGIKLHIADSNVDLLNPDHVRSLQLVFRAANERSLAIIGHFATQDPDFGRRHVQIYLDQIFPFAPSVPIQVAHLAGHGPAHGEEALAAFAEAARRGDPRLRNVYFEAASNVMSFTNEEQLTQIAAYIRDIGIERVLFGTDRPAGGPNFTGDEAWKQFLRLPLTEREFRTIAENVTPYIR